MDNKDTPSAPRSEADTSAANAASTGEADNTLQPSYESLVLMLQDAQAKAEGYRDQAIRALAEQENARRRAERELERGRKYVLESFLQELLPVRDSLEMGSTAAQDANVDISKLREGTDLTLKMLDTAIAKFGVKEINPLGEPFNPEQHQAMSMQEAPNKPPNTVIMVFQKGYLLNDRLMRPARVVVSKAPNANGGNNMQA